MSTAARMPAEFWLSVIAQLAALLGAYLRIEHRLSTLEADVRWLMTRRRSDQDALSGTHPGP